MSWLQLLVMKWHALREHGREASMNDDFTNLGLKYGASALGLGGTEQQIAEMVTKYGLTLPNSRKHENEADLVGLEIMARAGYNPNAAIVVWKKMATEIPIIKVKQLNFEYTSCTCFTHRKYSKNHSSVCHTTRRKKQRKS